MPAESFAPARAGRIEPSPNGTPPDLAAQLRRIVAPERVLTRPLDLVAFASDASLYRLMPLAVVLAASADEVAALFRLSHRIGVPLTFRAAGTSLSGQAQGNGILVEVKRHFTGWQVLDQGAQVRVRPGSLAGAVNSSLARHGRKLGPDPASLAAATVGGILANNSSGMCCGIAHNSYRTLEHISFVLPSGTMIDTSRADAEHAFATSEPDLAAGLLKARADLLADTSLHERIRRKHAIKNTTGYGLNALLDYDTPLSMFAHLLVGSEGTLAFISEAVVNTVPVDPYRATAFALFPDLATGCAAVDTLRTADASAIELLDRASLAAVADRPGVPAGLADLPPTAAALLVDLTAPEAATLTDRVARAEESLRNISTLSPVHFTTDAALQDEYWRVRSGLFTSVGAARPPGTAVVLEDVAFPPADLAAGVADLERLHERHGYPAVIFGHARDGNLHFLLTPAFGVAGEVERYAAFMADLTQLVGVTYEGSLKAEHGTGRNMAPFVRTEWGDAAYALMRRIKDLADPTGLLGPGVLLNDDPQAHVSMLKSVPLVDPLVDRCIECGYCERVCPSRDLTVTPRQRIVILRELARLDRQPATEALTSAITRDATYAVRDTCAGDGLCELACPVDIDTGKLVKALRAKAHPRVEHDAANRAARSWATAERMSRSALRLARRTSAVASPGLLNSLTRALRRVTGDLVVPEYLDDTPAPAPPLPATTKDGAVAVYLPACVTRMFGPGERAGLPVPDSMVTLARRAGRPVWIPDDVVGTCCGTVWESKGFPEGAATMAAIVAERAWRWTDGGRLPLLTDASSCALAFGDLATHLDPENAQHWQRIRVLDSISFVTTELLPHLGDRLARRPKLATVAVHATCAVQHAGDVDTLTALVAQVADTVLLPGAGNCCGFAGDRGFWRPELSESATAPIRTALDATPPADDHVCTNRPCEIGLSHGTGRQFRSVLALLEERTR
jgi:D-lactate dehydrogenase